MWGIAIRIALQLAITSSTIYAGYYLITQRRPRADPEPVAIVEPSKPTTAAPQKKTPVRKRVQDAPVVQPQELEIQASPTIAPIAPPISPFENSPSTVDLPPSDDLNAVTLFKKLKDTDVVQFVSNANALEHQDTQLLWKADESDDANAIAVLNVIEGDLVFRWLPPVTDEAESALRNSIVRLQSDEFQHVFALRHPKFTKSFEIDLHKPLQRITSKCEFLPAVEDVWFELSGMKELPQASTDGSDLSRLQVRDQTTLEYTDAQGAATRLTAKKRGKLITIEVESRYVLPSGEKQAMTIERGNRRLKELAAVHEQAQGAAETLTNLRKQLSSLQGDAQAVPRSRLTATAKSARLRELQNSILAIQQQIQYAQQLEQQKDAIAADHDAIQRIAKLAQQLHEVKLTYRFFTVVDGHEVDVLVAQ